MNYHTDANPNPDPTFLPDADLDTDLDPSFQIKTQKVSNRHLPFSILACHLQTDADPDPDYKSDADPYGSGSTTLTVNSFLL